MPESQKEKKARREREKALRDIAKEEVCCIANYALSYVLSLYKLRATRTSIRLIIT